MTRGPSLSERFVAHYEAEKRGLPGAGLDWLPALRGAARESFAALGLPTQRSEEWRYTSLAPLARLAFAPARAARNGIAAASLPWLLPAQAGAHRLVFVNGMPRPDLSAPGALPAGVTLASLAAALVENPVMLVGRLGALGAIAEQPMLALNTALMADGYVLHLARGTALAHPVELLFIALSAAEPVSYHPRGLIIAEAGSSATVVEQHIGIGSGTTLANMASEILIEEGAALRHYKLAAEGEQAFHVSLGQVQVASRGRYESFVLAHGGRLTRNEIRVRLDGPGASCALDGAYLGGRRQHIDNTTFIDHAKPQTTSRELYKGVLDGYARGVFQGRILVRPDAQKTDGQQTSKALLLSPGAEIDAKPQLEIYADDVKCSHGAAAGELDEEALFYLRSRGIAEREARHMLIEAFLGEAVERIASEPVREAFAGRLAAALASIAPELRG
ncbi:MAG: Fe-S cluster assembly protein SufD [Alphaproteobacteria bacterium]